MSVKTEALQRVAVRATEHATETGAERLKSAIKQIGTVALISERSGVPKGTINGYLVGKEMSFRNATALAKATGVTLEWLATGIGPMKPGQPENPQETAPQRPLSLWRDTHMETLIAAYRSALQTLIAAGKDDTDAAAVMRITALLYDELTGSDER